MKKLIFVYLFLVLSIVTANPIFVIVSRDELRLKKKSEQLKVDLSLDFARIRGDFIFFSENNVSKKPIKDGFQVMLPILFPQGEKLTKSKIEKLTNVSLSFDGESLRFDAYEKNEKLTSNLSPIAQEAYEVYSLFFDSGFIEYEENRILHIEYDQPNILTPLGKLFVYVPLLDELKQLYPEVILDESARSRNFRVTVKSDTSCQIKRRSKNKLILKENEHEIVLSPIPDESIEIYINSKS